MFECITLTIPAKESALSVVRLTTAGVAVRGNMDYETLEDVKTAVYEACYAMSMQKYVPKELVLRFEGGEVFSVSISGAGPLKEGEGRMPDVRLCNAVLSTMIPHVDVEMDQKGIRCIRMHR